MRSQKYGGRPEATAETRRRLSVSILFKNSRNLHFRADLTLSGLAISGGVDSMALAALCSQMHLGLSNITQSQKLEKPSSLLESLHQVYFRAFVVDHGVRSGSATEAQAVAKVLEERGIVHSFILYGDREVDTVTRYQD